MERDSDFSEFASAHWTRLVRSARLFGLGHHEAEDLAQTALVKCYVGWAKVSRADSIDAYVARVLLNAYRQSKRRRWWGELPTERLPDVGIDDQSVNADQADALRRALDLLPSSQREAIVLRHYLGLSEAETAEVLGVPTGTVKSRLSRARAQLALNDDLRNTLDGSSP